MGSCLTRFHSWIASTSDGSSAYSLATPMAQSSWEKYLLGTGLPSKYTWNHRPFFRTLARPRSYSDSATCSSIEANLTREPSRNLCRVAVLHCGWAHQRHPAPCPGRRRRRLEGDPGQLPAQGARRAPGRAFLPRGSGSPARAGDREDDKLWQEVAASLPSYRLSKFQPLMPPWVEREMVASHLLDLEGAWRFLGGTLA